MGLQVPNISRDTLRKKTQRAVKIYKLSAKIGLDKIKHIKNYSANSISELTNDQIQEIINHGLENQISNSPSLEITPEVSSEDNIIEISGTARLEEPKNPTHDRAYFRNKIVWEYSDLYKEFSSEKFDYYGIIDKSLCPACKLSHKDEKSIRGRYEAGSYFIKCGQQEIEITA